ncbi:hypothetical protein U9M48_025312 [Paspalum notatum var. saurae]|uniref:Uncharacterized protein n=1 Tax=Paspalum notatum var. saurae TaxID=547442 RepID=A0AAQ3TQH4_PASNO
MRSKKMINFTKWRFTTSQRRLDQCLSFEMLLSAFGLWGAKRHQASNWDIVYAGCYLQLSLQEKKKDYNYESVELRIQSEGWLKVSTISNGNLVELISITETLIFDRMQNILLCIVASDNTRVQSLVCKSEKIRIEPGAYSIVTALSPTSTSTCLEEVPQLSRKKSRAEQDATEQSKAIGGIHESDELSDENEENVQGRKASASASRRLLRRTRKKACGSTGRRRLLLDVAR